MLREWITTAHVIEGLIAGLILLLTLVGLWRTTGMTNFIRSVWIRSFGRAHHQLRENAKGVNAKLDTVLDHLNGGGKLAVVEEGVNRIEDKQESFYALMGARLDADHQAVVITDAAGKVQTISRAFQEYTGMDLNMMEGDGWVNLIHPEDRAEVVKQWDSVVRDGREMSVDQRYVRPDNGRILHVHIKVYRQRDTKGNIRGYLAVIHPLESSKMCPYSANPEVCAAAHDKKWDCEGFQ